MTMMANVCAPQDSLVPVVSKVSRRACTDWEKVLKPRRRSFEYEAQQSLHTTHLVFSLQRGPFWTELPGTVPRHSRLSGSHFLPPGSLWMFLWIWLEGKPVPGRYGLSHFLWA